MTDGLHNLIATGLAAWAAGVTGGTATVANMRGSSAVPLDSIPGAPYTVVGPGSDRHIPGSSQDVFLMRFPMRCYTARLSNNAHAQHDTYEYLDGFYTAVKTDISLGGIVTAAWIESADTNKFDTVSGEDYQVVDMVMAVEAYLNATYT